MSSLTKLILIILGILLSSIVIFNLYPKNSFYNEKFFVLPSETPLPSSTPPIQISSIPRETHPPNYDPQCDPETGEIPTSLKQIKSSSDALNASIKTDKEYYDAICNKGQTSCDKYKQLLQVCYNKNGRDSKICKNIMPSCVEAPDGLKLLSCDGIKNVINANILFNQRKQENIALLECKNCTYCSHPSDVSLCNSVCNNNNILQIRPPPTLTTSNVSSMPSPTLHSISSSNPTNNYNYINTPPNYNTDSMNANYTNTTKPTFGTSATYSSTPTYPFTLNSTDMNTSSLFDEIDSFMPFDINNNSNSSYNYTLNPNIYDISGNTNTNTYDNINPSPNFNSILLQTQLFNQMQQASAPAYPIMSSLYSIPPSTNSLQSNITNSTPVPPGIYQDHISGVSNVFAPTIILQQI